MSDAVGPSVSFTATTGTPGYPLRCTQGVAAAQSPDGTATAGSSALITTRIAALESVIVENPAADGIVTISDHAGDTDTDIVLNITAAAVQQYHFGPYGIEVPWTGIKAVVTGAANRVRVVCRPSY